MLVLMRVHRILAETSAQLLKLVFRERRVLDMELSKTFHKNPKLGKRDRAFIAETVYEVARWRRALAFVADSDEIRAMCAAQWLRMGYEVPSWWSYHGADVVMMGSRQVDLRDQIRPIRESVPDWLDDWLCEEIGEDLWSRELSALNQRAPVYLRINSLKGDSDEVIDWLTSEGVDVEPISGVPGALRLAQGRVISKQLFADGRIEIQDAGSQCIVPLLGAEPGERVIDACSGAGGKALQLAAVMSNEGRIYAMDVDERKLAELKQRARRAGARNIVIKPITDTTAADFFEVADRLLIDAPCSGLGTLKRQPDLKWRLRPATIERARVIQRELLLEYSKMLKPGGRLVYATCSILPSENWHVVETLLETGGFNLIEERKLSPSVDGFDGFYAAALKKRG